MATFSPCKNYRYKLWRTPTNAEQKSNILFIMLNPSTASDDKDDKTIVLLGYSPQELKKHLETLSLEWVNYEIDHKIPITWFEENTPVSVVNDFRNLQLLSKSENNKKRNFWMSDVDDVYLNEVKQYIKKEYLIQCA